MGGYCRSLLWEFTMGVYHGRLPWEFTTGSYRGSLQQELTMGGYCGRLPRELTAGLCRGLCRGLHGWWGKNQDFMLIRFFNPNDLIGGGGDINRFFGFIPGSMWVCTGLHRSMWGSTWVYVGVYAGLCWGVSLFVLGYIGCP